jgi:uncharacterized damage-inducible protein DinB
MKEQSGMRKIVAFLILVLSVGAYAQAPKVPTLKSILLEQLRTTHKDKDWFVPANAAVEGLTPEQASWKDGKGNHSIGQLTVHLIFWNKEQLAKFRGEQPAKFSGDNNETFDSFDSKTWTAAVKELDEVLTALEKEVEAMNDKELDAWASNIAHIGTHNAYHVGQMIYIRKEQGWWDPDKGVK